HSSPSRKLSGGFQLTSSVDVIDGGKSDAPAEKVKINMSATVSRGTIREMFMFKIISEVAYIAICLKMEQPASGVFDLDVEQFATAISFTDCPAGKKEKKYTITPEAVHAALSALGKKDALQVDRPVQIEIGLFF
ncbi:MAG: hypothetical protein ACRC62_32270, partial [Microcoleus sp.]